MMTESLPKRASAPSCLNIYDNSHKVIAYPNATQRIFQQNSLLATPSREAIEEGSSIQIPTLRPVSLRTRSLSAGRTRRSGNDLIQGVYDRLGLTRANLVDAADSDQTGSSRFQMTANSASERGRCREPSATDDTPRARSLSRDGRLLSRWPPVTASASADLPSSSKPIVRTFRSTATTSDEVPSPAAAMASTDEPSPPRPMVRTLRSIATNNEEAPSSSKHAIRIFRGTSTANEEGAPPSHMRRVARSPEEVAALLSPKPRYSRSKDTPVSPGSPKLMTFRNAALNIFKINNSKSAEWKEVKKECPALKISSTKSSEWRDEKKEEESTSYEDVRTNVPSVKDRMRAFAGPEPTKKEAPKGVVNKLYPPQIDIFGGESNREAFLLEEKKEDDNSGSLGKHLQKHNSKQLPPNESSCALASPEPPPAKSTDLAGAFLAAIQTSPAKSLTTHRHSYAPVTEISGDDQGSVSGSVSVSQLSTATSDDQTSPTYGNKLSNQGNTIKKPTWLEQRGKRLSGDNKAGPTAQHLSSPPPPSRVAAYAASSIERNALIEKMVDERVQARISELERRFEEQMRTFMHQMDAKVTSRMADLERNS